MPLPAPFIALAAATAATTPAAAAAFDPATVAAIEATCFDYVDGQLEGDIARVARALHPDLAKRRVTGDTPDERLGLQRMTKEELVGLTREGALKTPREQWNRSCRLLDVTGEAAVVRAETPGSSIISTWAAMATAGSSSTRCGTPNRARRPRRNDDWFMPVFPHCTASLATFGHYRRPTSMPVQARSSERMRGQAVFPCPKRRRGD